MKRWTFTRSVSLIAATALCGLAVGACGQKNAGQTDAGGGNGSMNLPGEMQGVTDNEIRIGTIQPLSGDPAAIYGNAIAKGMQAYYDYINDNGGMYGRKIKLILGDNQYSGSVASEAARRLVEQDKVFAIQGSEGTAPHSAIYKYLEEHGIPDMYILSGSATFVDPVARTRFGGLVDYVTEGRVFATYIKQNFDGQKLGILAQNDDFGKEGEQGLRQGLQEQGANMDITVEYFDETNTDVTSQVQRLKGADVNIVAFWGGPLQAANLIKTARETLSWQVPVMINGTNALDILGQLAGYDNIEGTVSGMMGHQAFETDNPGVARAREIVAKYAPDVPFDNMVLIGYSISEGMTGFLKQAGKDLTQESFIKAAESLCNYKSDLFLVPQSTSPTDHRLSEADVLVRATTDRSSGTPVFRWVPFGDVISFESTTNCTVPTPPAGAASQPGPSLQNVQTPKP